MQDSDDRSAAGTVESSAPPQKKSKRVRTGCLTCRERHLKCDEGLPNCQNCCKSNRVCKRGVRLNFIDTQVQAPPVVPRSNDWSVNFMDESRDIASEYKGGLSRYGVQEPDNSLNGLQNAMAFDFVTSAAAAAALPALQSLPSIQGMLPDTFADENAYAFEAPREHQHQHHHTHSLTETSYSGSNMQHTPATAYSNPDRQPSPHEETRDYLTTQEEVLFMQVFVEEVGLWMDSMDPQKHFSRLLPFHALSEPMLLNAFLACGARHLALVNPKYTEDKALHYYDTATRYLLNSLQNPNRDTVICATTAVILNVYEIMCERALQRMNHIAGARALIKECGWNARSTGVGAACFWLNVGMELLSCLHFNWQVAWDPDDWGVDMDFSRETESGKEEVWTYRIVYIVAKICNFRASIPRFHEASPRDEHIRLENRYKEWLKLKAWCDAWNENIPRTMHPMAYLYPGQTHSGSAFPEVWLIKRTTIVARLFYHTAMVLLAQINPIMSVDSSDEMRDMQTRHSQLICGITAHVKDRGVASVALRSLAIAAECLTNRREQEEVLQIFTKTRQETGWNVGFVYKELKEKWGWNNTSPHQQTMQIPPNHSPQHHGMPVSASLQQPMSLRAYQPAPPAGVSNGPMMSMSSSTMAPVSSPPRAPMPAGILNPLLATADFGMPQHPYQNYYVAPNPMGQGGAHFGGAY